MIDLDTFKIEDIISYLESYGYVVLDKDKLPADEEIP